MPLSLLRTLLLVLACGFAAHARHLAPSQVNQKDVVTSLLNAGVAHAANNNNNKDVNVNVLGRHSRRTLLSLDAADADNIRSPLSVVQDWSLVCQQLCGAGLAGAPCGAYCHSDVIPSQQQQANADALLNSNKEAICYDLCRLQLGDDACHCAAADQTEIKTDLSISERNAVCSSFCQHNATLTGCSRCAVVDDVMLSPLINELTTDNVDAVNSSETFTFMVRSGDSTTTTTTPNWSEICASLCKTGDGGSLCNCDLSPFNGRKY